MNFNLDATPEWQEEFINELVADLIRSQELVKTLISNTEYILWLEKFTISNPSFADDSWLYQPEKISKEDSKRVDELSSFFEGIMEYVDRNFIPLGYDEFGGYVFIKFNNIGYKIGVMIGQGSVTYCKRVDISSNNIFIDFNDILNNKKQENVDYICERLDFISSIIQELLKMGVSEKAISTMVRKALDK